MTSEEVAAAILHAQDAFQKYYAQFGLSVKFIVAYEGTGTDGTTRPFSFDPDYVSPHVTLPPTGALDRVTRKVENHLNIALKMLTPERVQ